MDNYQQINEKRKQTTLKRYGVDNVSKLNSVQDKRRKSFEVKRNTVIFYQEPRINNIQSSDLNIYRLDKKYSDTWLNTYHPFKSPRGTVLSLGLVKDDQVYCIMTFKKSRNKNYSAELSRMWMLPTYNVIDGYDILSSEATKFGVGSIISYVNLSFENHHDYESIGMKHVRTMQRTKWWIYKNEKMISDASRRQYGYSIDEMLNNNWKYVYDCGQYVYVFE